MHVIRLAHCILIVGSMTGCAVIESPRSWGWNSPGKNMPTVGPNDIQLGAAAKGAFGDRLSAMTTYQDLSALISDTRAAVAGEKANVRAALDEASGGNYGWGILGAAAGIANLHISALKGIALAGGAHVALSTRLSPKDQIAILTDTITRLGCVGDVARANARADDALAKSKADLVVVTNIASAQLQTKALERAPDQNTQRALAFMAATLEVDRAAAIAPAPAPSLDDFRAAIENILYNASNKIDGLFTTALANTSTASDLVSSTNTLVTKLKGNAITANAAVAAAETTKANLKSTPGVTEQTANNVAEAQKVVAEAKKNADDATTTAAVRLAACQS